MEIKSPTPQIPPPVWREFKDLQEWEKYRQERPEDDKHSAVFERATEGVYNFPGGFIATGLADAVLNWARKSSVWPVTFGLASRLYSSMRLADSLMFLARMPAAVPFGTRPASSMLAHAASSTSSQTANRWSGLQSSRNAAGV